MPPPNDVVPLVLVQTLTTSGDITCISSKVHNQVAQLGLPYWHYQLSFKSVYQLETLDPMGPINIHQTYTWFSIELLLKHFTQKEDALHVTLHCTTSQSFCQLLRVKDQN